MLDGARILVAEDAALIGIDLADHFQAFGARVIGPVATVREAMNLIEGKSLNAALLDFNLEDGDVRPLLKELAARGVPTVIYSGQNLSAELRKDYPDIKVLQKPVPMHLLVVELADACRRADPTPEACARTLRVVSEAMGRPLRRANGAMRNVVGRRA
jgi:DNA-binding response OmpR family regulator